MRSAACTNNAAGNWTYTANDNQAAIQQLSSGQSFTDSFPPASSATLFPYTTLFRSKGTDDTAVIGGVHTGSVTEDVNVVGGNLITSGALTITDAEAGQAHV